MQTVFSEEFKALAMPFFNSMLESLPLAKTTVKNDVYTIQHLLPGFEKDNFNVSVEDSRKVILDYNRSEDSTNEWDFNFEKSYSTDFDIDTASMKAGFVNGIFTVEFTKVQDNQPESIDVQID